MHRSRVLIVDDHLTLGEALVARLIAEPDIASALPVASTDSAFAVLRAESFDIALVDVNLTGDDGLTLTARLRELYPQMVILMLTCVTDIARVVMALQVGASGWVPKDAPIHQLLEAMRQVRAGGAWLSGPMLRDVLDILIRRHSEQDRAARLLSRLSSRELEVLRELAAGRDLPTIAGRLFLSENTVRTHIQNILAKLKVHSRVAAVALVRDQLSADALG